MKKRIASQVIEEEDSEMWGLQAVNALTDESASFDSAGLAFDDVAWLFTATTGSGILGLVILWRDGVEVEVVSSIAHYIDVIIRGLFEISEWRLTRLYGWAQNEDKWRTWQLMRELKSLLFLPWVVIGDFNQILFEHEKRGGAPRDQRSMDEFREAMDECGLMDIGFSEEPFTWWNIRGGSEAVFERLDRALVSPSFLEVCPTTTLSHLEYDKSNHAPIILSMFADTNQKKGQRFRFEDMWANSEECEDVLHGAWLETTGRNLGHNAMHKLDLCSRRLAQWSKIQFGDLRKRIEETRNRMNFLDSCSHDLAAVVEHKSMCANLDELLIAEEVFWRQRSRKYWHIIGKDVADYVIGCLDGRVDMTDVNHTHIVLIPKCKQASELSNFRPISLCNVVYTLISKVLVGSLKGFLDDLIDVEQNAFIPGRLL
ncbi:uncharacterized protein LOC141632422 [Silene latifolia]|uniref:uncharacterized protein LOC141632422 n=1 Tax=Silene latifolia TaxID=37657 RepID=UPI003D787054